MKTERRRSSHEGSDLFDSFRIFGLVLILSLLFIALTVHIRPDGFYSSLFDDAMISFKYARNIADGIGPYWNQNDRVEGFTNPLWTYLMSAVYLASGSRENLAPLLVQVVCSVLLASNCFLFSTVAGKMRAQAVSRGYSASLSRFLYLGASLSPVLFYPNIYWTLMGMEIALLTFLASILFITLFYAHVFRSRIFGSNTSQGLLTFLVCAIGQLTRPDFVLIPVSLLVAKFIFSSKINVSRVYSLAVFSLSGIAASSVAIFSWRSLLFDARVPNTYQLKVTGVDIATQLKSGIGFVLPMIKSYFPFILLLAVILWCSKKDGRVLIWSSLSYFLAVLLYQIRVGGDPWSYWRTFSSALVLMGFSGFSALLLFDSDLKLVFGLSDHLVNLKGPIYISAGIFLSFSLLIANQPFITSDLLVPLRILARTGQFPGVYQVSSNRQNIDSAKALSRILPKGSKIGVFWAGTIPYYMSDYYAVDFLGKSDARIASLRDRGGVSWNGMLTVPGHNKYDLRWSLSHYQPDWIQYAKWGKDDLTNDPLFVKSYAYCAETDGYLKIQFMNKCESS